MSDAGGGARARPGGAALLFVALGVAAIPAFGVVRAIADSAPDPGAALGNTEVVPDCETPPPAATPEPTARSAWATTLSDVSA